MGDDVPVILAIETSQRAGGVALRTRSGTVDAELVHGDRRHDDDLMPAIDRVFARNGLVPSDLDVVGVSIGPGGFTGLRIGIATAKTLAETLDATLVAVPTAVAVAEAYGRDRDDEGPIVVTLFAKEGTVWTTCLRRAGSGGWRIDGEPSLQPAEGVQLDDVTALIGDRHLPEAFRTRAGAAGVPVVEPAFDPTACLTVTERSVARGDTIDALALEPLYARAPSATPPRPRR